MVHTPLFLVLKQLQWWQQRAKCKCWPECRERRALRDFRPALAVNPVL